MTMNEYKYHCECGTTALLFYFKDDAVKCPKCGKDMTKIKGNTEKQATLSRSKTTDDRSGKIEIDRRAEG